MVYKKPKHFKFRPKFQRLWFFLNQTIFLKNLQKILNLAYVPVVCKKSKTNYLDLGGSSRCLAPVSIIFGSYIVTKLFGIKNDVRKSPFFNTKIWPYKDFSCKMTFFASFLARVWKFLPIGGKNISYKPNWRYSS